MNASRAARFPRRTALLASGALFGTGGCDNAPHPATERASNTFFSSYLAPPTHLDPARGEGSFGALVSLDIYEPPLQYHFLERPFRLIPLTAAAEPTVATFDTAGRRIADDAPSEEVARVVYTITIRSGIFYQDHPCFARDEAGALLYRNLAEHDVVGIDRATDLPHQGTRELLARDYVWQLKRLAHPALQSPALGTLRLYVEGLDALAERLRTALARERASRRDAVGPLYDQTRDERSRPLFLDLDAFELPGAQVVDRYTYRLTLTERYPQLRFWLASLFLAPIPREADEFYAQGPLLARGISLDTNPVGTGPYRLETFAPDREIVLLRNPRFRGEPYPTEGTPGDAEAGLLRDAGKPMPFIDRAVYKLEREHIPRWNKFVQGYYDTSRLTSDMFDQSVVFTPAGELALTDEMAARGLSLVDSVSPLLIYFAWNLADPQVGGLTPERRKLRQAFAIAVDTQELNEIFQNSRDIPAHGPVPPGIFGYEADRVNPFVFEASGRGGALRRRPLEDARRLLAEAGYPEGRDADGRPLTITFDTSARSVDRPFLDWMRKQFARLGVDLRIRSVDASRLAERVARGDFQLVRSGMQLPYPDPEGAFLPFYGPTARGLSGNVAGYRSEEFDACYRRLRTLPDGEERHALIGRMTTLLQEDAVWIWDVFLRDPLLYHRWNANLKPLTITGWWGGSGTLKYRRVDGPLRAQSQGAWNQPVRWPALGATALAGLGFLLLRRAQRRLDERTALPPTKTNRRTT